MIERLSDKEIICAWMEPNTGMPIEAYQLSPLNWWKARYSATEKRLRWVPYDRVDSLDALWEVEERLTPEQWKAYEKLRDNATEPPPRKVSQPWVGAPLPSYFRDICHATAEQKIRALVAVLRPIVEARKVPVLDGVFNHQPECRAPDYQECTCKPAAETKERP